MTKTEYKDLLSEVEWISECNCSLTGNDRRFRICKDTNKTWLEHREVGEWVESKYTTDNIYALLEKIIELSNPWNDDFSLIKTGGTVLIETSGIVKPEGCLNNVFLALPDHFGDDLLLFLDFGYIRARSNASAIFYSNSAGFTKDQVELLRWARIPEKNNR